MADVTFLGLGRMGAALARCVRGAGHDTVVWNRTAARAEPLVAEGARYLSEVAEAIAASPLVVVCVDDYAASDSFLGTAASQAALQGRTLVQLSTGSPRVARAAHGRAKALGVGGYLDGAIMAYPSGIGTDACLLLTSGDRSAFSTARPVLERLSPATQFLGEDAGLASALDEALLSPLIAVMVGTINGAALSEAGGLSIGTYREMLEALMPVWGGAAMEALRKVEVDDFEAAEATLGAYAAAVPNMVETAEEAGFSPEVPKLFGTVFDRAMEQGLGDADIAALIRVLRPAAK